MQERFLNASIHDFKGDSVQYRSTLQWTTRITETGITNLTRITNEMAASSDYLMEYFNGILAVLLE